MLISSLTSPLRPCLRIAAAIVAGTALVGGCSAPAEFANCPDDLRVGTSPTRRAIRVGESFTARADALGCAGTKRLPEAWIWRAADTAVVRVDSLAGRITGRAPGTTRVTPVGRQYGAGVDVEVIVQ